MSDRRKMPGDEGYPWDELREVIAQILMCGGTVDLTQAMQIRGGQWPLFDDYIDCKGPGPGAIWTVTEKGKRLLIRGDT